MARGGQSQRGRRRSVVEEGTVSAADSKTVPSPKQVTPQKALLAGNSNAGSPSAFCVNREEKTSVCLAGSIGGVEVSEPSGESGDGFDYAGDFRSREENEETEAENDERLNTTDEDISQRWLLNSHMSDIYFFLQKEMFGINLGQ
jgi:hypothetical protein